MILAVEELSINAWPALQTVLIDGWVLRFANGFSKRANSINPLYPSKRTATEKIAACEKIYRDRDLPVVFKMTNAAYPEGLDSLLAERGYQTESATSVQLLDLNNCDLSSELDTAFTPLTLDAWQSDFCRMNGIEGKNQTTHRLMLQSIIPAACFASLRVEDRIIACGLGILQGGFLGLFDIVTSPDCRRRGYGERLVRSLLSWAKHQGAHTAYLQVMLNNAPSLRLYARIGFQETYQYWYRVNHSP
ncbi:MAG: GNAT family N-acetyltransferase [Deltaproteobacteria bacterium]|nr:GNAT family N-acetyltransferase [Deltaproteobacteria bacterium]